MRILHLFTLSFAILTATLSTLATDYTTYVNTARGFTEVTSEDGIIADPQQCYLITAAENTQLFVGIGRYEAKPGWAGEDTKALRYRQAGDPVTDLSNFFTIEKENEYIGLRNVVLHTSLFQTHDNAGYMYVLTYTEPTMSDWCYLKPTYQNGYWLFENGKYPISSDNWACGYMGPWNNRVEANEPIALNRRNTTGDEAGHYRLWRISRANLLSLQQTISNSDATWHVQNPSFETGDDTGWTLSGKEDSNNEFMVRGDYGMTNKDGSYLMNAYQWWAPSLSVSQTISDLPAGEYEVSGVVAAWEGRTVTLSANNNTVTQNGQGDGTGIRVNTSGTIITDGQLTITCESTGRWWVGGHEGETQTFFKLDDVQLHCRSLYLDGVAVRLPNNGTKLIAGQWYYYDVDYNTEYQLIGPLNELIYTTNGNVPCASATGSTPTRTMTLPVGRTYFKTSADNATLVIMPYRNVTEGTFTCVALNVDGLPKEINYVVGKYELNPDGPGAEGTLKISQYLASKNYDFIGCSEDFNYNGSLMEYLNDNYSCGTIRKTLSVGGLDYGELIKGNLHVETDGLNLIWKNSFGASNESWTRWNSTESTDGNQYVEKGFRHYDMTLQGGIVIDVYILHMDAGDTNATWSRHAQWEQLCDAINASDLSRAKLIIGDTNSRWTREDIISHFKNRLSSNLTMSDVWVEFYRGGIYPTTDMSDLTDATDPTDYSKYEIVDKIIYINPTAANTVRLTPQTFRIEQDYTYGYVNALNGGANDDNTPLGDHHPVVVTFKYQYSNDVTPASVTLLDNSDNATTINNAYQVLANVTLQGRTLYKDNSWNTICLPFSMTAEQVQAQLAPAALKQLDINGTYNGHTTGIEGNTLYLNFKDATTIEAGVPYIIKWTAGDDIVNPSFTNVTLSDAPATAVTSVDATVSFQGTYSPTPLPSGDKSNLYVAADNRLHWPSAQGYKVNAFRAYFHINEGAANVNTFVLNFDDTTTGINTIGQFDNLQSDNCYNLAGQMVNDKLQRGIYIVNKKKMVVK